MTRASLAPVLRGAPGGCLFAHMPPCLPAVPRPDIVPSRPRWIAYLTDLPFKKWE